MFWMTEKWDRIVIEILVGITVAILAIVLFLDIQIEWKILMIMILAIEAALIFLGIIDWFNKMRMKINEWKRCQKIRKHPELIYELYRLVFHFQKLLYERSNEHASLVLQGEETINALYAGTCEGWLPNEFGEKIMILQNSYDIICDNLKQRQSEKYLWNSREFADVLLNIGKHFESLKFVFETVFRQSLLWPKEKSFPKPAIQSWEAFRVEYNSSLKEWETFTERFNIAVGLGGHTNVKPAMPLPVTKDT